jgi:hypothetical protein
MKAKETKKASKKETFKINGTELIKKVKDLIQEGNVREITISDKDNKIIVVFPLTVGVVGAILAPPLAAIGAIAALVTECTITVVRK